MDARRTSVLNGNILRGGPFDTWGGGAMVFPSGSNFFFQLPA